MKTSVPFSAVLVVSALLSSPVFSADWTQFRGPNHSGVSSDDKSTPVTWSDTENLKWKTALPGAGSSSPIVLGNRVYVTCFSGVDETTGGVEQMKRHLICIDRENGKIVWDAEVAAEQPEDPYQGMLTQHGFASQTPVTDGERIYVFFGKTGVLAFDLEGNKLWQTNVGKESSFMRWGSGASPVLYKDYVIVNASDESQSIRALDKKTGNEVWKAEAAGLDQAYGTPALVDPGDGNLEVVIHVSGEVWALNPDNGKLRWYATTGSSSQISPSPIVDKNMVYVTGGRGSGAVAIRSGGKDDVTDSHVVWSNRDGSNVPTPVLYAGHLFWMDDQSIWHCVEAETGKSVTEQRISGLAAAGGRGEGGEGGEGGARGGRGGFGRGGGGFGGMAAVYASPVVADGKVYAVTRRGGTLVVAAKPEFEQLALNRFESDDSQFNASPAISDGELFLRSDKFIYCVANK